MAVHITGTSAVPVGPTTSGQGVRALRLTINNGLTGTVTVNDSTGAVAIITNPATGQSFLYSGLLSPVNVTASVAGDITASILNSHS